MECYFCKFEINRDSNSCTKCGAEVPKCQNCNTLLLQFGKFCSNCGSDNAKILFSKAFDASEQQKHNIAFKLYELATELGHSGAMNNFGVRYYKGEGVGKDLKKAAFWYDKVVLSSEKLAESGDIDSMKELIKFKAIHDYKILSGDSLPPPNVAPDKSPKSLPNRKTAKELGLKFKPFEKRDF